jgi:hypothetical protein
METYSYCFRLSSASRYLPSSPVPTFCQLKLGRDYHRGLTASEECPHILGQPELFWILTQHLFGQLLENSRNRFNLLILLILNG